MTTIQPNIQWTVSAKIGKWSMMGTVSSWQIGAYDEEQLIERIKENAKEKGHVGEFDHLFIKEVTN